MNDAPFTRKTADEANFVGWLFSKNKYSRVAYSRHFKRTLDDSGDGVYRQTDLEFIPALPESGVAEALKKLRSGILPVVGNLPSSLYDLDDDDRSWGALAPFIWYNILLGPYEWGAQRSKRLHATVEDADEAYNAKLDEPAEMTIRPRFDDDSVSYFGNTILHRRGSPETYFGVTYRSPPEDAIVDYIRRKRKEFDQNGEKFMFVLFHNLLVPYVFG